MVGSGLNGHYWARLFRTLYATALRLHVPHTGLSAKVVAHQTRAEGLRLSDTIYLGTTSPPPPGPPAKLHSMLSARFTAQVKLWGIWILPPCPPTPLSRGSAAVPSSRGGAPEAETRQRRSSCAAAELSRRLRRRNAAQPRSHVSREGVSLGSLACWGPTCLSQAHGAAAMPGSGSSAGVARAEVQPLNCCGAA